MVGFPNLWPDLRMGDIAYDLIWLWPLFGFGFGYAAATIVERVHRKLWAVVKDKEDTGRA